MVDYRELDDDEDETVAGEMVLDENNGEVHFVAAEDEDISMTEEPSAPSPFSQPMPQQASPQARPSQRASLSRAPTPQPGKARPTRKPRPVAMDSGFMTFDSSIRSLMDAPTLNLMHQHRSSGVRVGIIVAAVVVVLALGFIVARALGTFDSEPEVVAPKGFTWSMEAAPAGIEVFYDNRYVGEIPCTLREENEKANIPLKFVAGDKTLSLTLPGMVGEQKLYLKNVPTAEALGWRRVVAPPPAVPLRDDILLLGTTPLIVIGPLGTSVTLEAGEGRHINVELLADGGDFSVY